MEGNRGIEREAARVAEWQRRHEEEESQRRAERRRQAGEATGWVLGGLLGMVLRLAVAGVIVAFGVLPLGLMAFLTVLDVTTPGSTPMTDLMVAGLLAALFWAGIAFGALVGGEQLLRSHPGWSTWDAVLLQVTIVLLGVLCLAVGGITAGVGLHHLLRPPPTPSLAPLCLLTGLAALGLGVLLLLRAAASRRARRSMS